MRIEIKMPDLDKIIAFEQGELDELGQIELICSQLVDRSEEDGGTHLFSDGRWPGFVMPTDLGALLGTP